MTDSPTGRGSGSRRRGRPPGESAAETRARIIRSARHVFAVDGLSKATMKAIASGASVAPTAVYHYFESKSALYEAVFFATVYDAWRSVFAAAHVAPTFREAAALILIESSDTDPDSMRFLTALPTVVGFHPELIHLRDERRKVQMAAIHALAELGVSTGEFGDLSVDEVTDFLFPLIVGWFVEREFSHLMPSAGAGGVLRMLERLTSLPPVEPLRSNCRV